MGERLPGEGFESEVENSVEPAERGNTWLSKKIAAAREYIDDAGKAAGSAAEKYLQDPLRNILLTGVIVNSVCSIGLGITGHPEAALHSIAVGLSNAGAVKLLDMYRSWQRGGEDESAR